MTLFPILYDVPAEEAKTPKEYEIDFNTGQLTGRTVEGLEAIKVWIWLALKTARYRYCVYSWDYGSELEDLIGQGYSADYIVAEAQRMVEDCLLINSDIKSITNFTVNTKNDQLNISFTVDTLYGSISMQL